MKKYNLYTFASIILILTAVTSYFLGFYLDENSAGAGSYNGDFKHIWDVFKLFFSNDIIYSITHELYFDSRPPLMYILHETFNPFIESKIGYRRSVFLISMFLPISFYFCLNQKFKNEDKILLILVSSLVCLSPYFRTSAYWGLEENYGLIFLLLTYLSFNKFFNSENETGYKIHYLLFLTIFFSSCCIYVDQKLIIIPIICFLTILKSNKKLKFKLLSIFYYFLFSLPFIYLISLWGGIMSPHASGARKLGEQIHLIHLGYASTMIACYLLPLLFFKDKNIYELIKNFFLEKKNYFFIGLFTIYIVYLIMFYDFNEQLTAGQGIVHKISLALFKNEILRITFTYISFFSSGIIILIFFENKIQDLLILTYFYLLSIILWPLHQEYFDPLILLMAFTFLGAKLILNYKNVIFLFGYLSLLLIGSNIYYSNLLN